MRARFDWEIVIATDNLTKLRWMGWVLERSGLKARGARPDEYTAVDESGSDCEANAILKAGAVASSDKIALGEDSGLFVDALGGLPGTHTSRWAPGSDEDRARLILERLHGVTTRSARFVSAVAVVFPYGERHTGTGVIDGEIATQFVGPPELGYAAIFRSSGGLIPANDAVPPAAHRLAAVSLAAELIDKWVTSRTGRAGSSTGAPPEE